jgi:hypothetical protein
MDRASLLKTIAETGYNVGFGAKKHFATYDIVEKAPGWIGFISLSVGIFGLVFEVLSSRVPSATLTVLGVAALYISLYDKDKSKYDAAGKSLTQIFNDLRDLYRSVQGGGDIQSAIAELKSLEQRYYASCISKQIAVSDWYAHYKFFAQHQIGWIEEQKKFSWRDKIPLSMRFLLLVVVVCVVCFAAAWLLEPFRTSPR